MEDLSGKQLGQYQVVEALGGGGMASVYKAYQANMERHVALKILPRHLAAEPDFVSRFKNESKVIASLEHPNILPVYDFGEADGYTYLVMRYVEGGQTLSGLLQGVPLPDAHIQRLIGQIAAALDYAHSRGVIHRDVKPSNVLLDEHGNCLLSDFGLAKVLFNSSHLTASGAFLGTPKYASPEQCLGSSDIDQRSDVYSLGVIMYEMATGRPPFDAETPMGVVIKHIHDPLPMPRTINPDLPEAVERVILKALSKEPLARHSTAGELALAFYAAVEGCAEEIDGLPAARTAAPRKTQPVTVQTVLGRRFPRINKWITAGILGLILFFAGAGSIWVIDKFIQPSEPQVQSAVIPATTDVLPTQTLSPLPPSPTTVPNPTQTRTASPTQQSSENPSPTPSFEGYQVVADGSLIFRSGPGIVYRWVAGSPYSTGTEFLIEGRSEDEEWFFALLHGVLEGWVQISDLQTEIDLLTLPVIESPPTPLPAATSTPKPAQSKDKSNPTDAKPGKPTDAPTNDPYPYP